MSDVPLDAPLSWARDRDPDGGVAWLESMPVILDYYPQVTPEAYWRLSVAEHAFLLRHALGLPVTREDDDG